MVLGKQLCISLGCAFRNAPVEARSCPEHEGAAGSLQVLALGGRISGTDEALEIVLCGEIVLFGEHQMGSAVSRRAS